MKILVIGGGGFIGSHFVEYAVSAGHEVSVLTRRNTLSLRNLQEVTNQIRLIEGDFNDEKTLDSALSNQDLVYHFASMTSPAKTWTAPIQEVDHALKPALVLTEAAIRAGVRKLVFPSSGGTVYGPYSDAIDESASTNPQSPHGIIKRTIEQFLDYYRQQKGLAVDVFRIANAYGPRQATDKPQGVIGLWMKHILDGKSLQVYGDAKTLRDYIHVDDVARLMGHSITDLTSSDRFNLGTGSGTSILALLEVIKSTANGPVRTELHPRRNLDCASIVLDSSKLLNHFPGYHFRQLQEALPEVWAWYKNNYNPA